MALDVQESAIYAFVMYEDMYYSSINSRANAQLKNKKLLKYYLSTVGFMLKEREAW